MIKSDGYEYLLYFIATRKTIKIESKMKKPEVYIKIKKDLTNNKRIIKIVIGV